MSIADGLHKYHQKQQDERDRLVNQIARHQADINSMQAKLDAIEAGLPDVEAAMRREGREPVVRPKPQPDTIALPNQTREP